ncbi:hypothetical protein DC60_30820 [Streptomyces wadayamensis]|uniref:Uncharacterized protein n=1 Tax=Streptomyces wadayamensis TaxID=141454 RepID=A0ABR4SI07_9ACTN|nr:hypothetical protein DC60_30820 [Streptomyces wadayamensis]
MVAAADAAAEEQVGEEGAARVEDDVVDVEGAALHHGALCQLHQDHDDGGQSDHPQQPHPAGDQDRQQQAEGEAEDEVAAGLLEPGEEGVVLGVAAQGVAGCEVGVDEVRGGG